MISRFRDTNNELRVDEEQVFHEFRGLLGLDYSGNDSYLEFDRLISIGHLSTRQGYFNMGVFEFWCAHHRILGFTKFIYHDFLDGRYQFDLYYY